MSAPGRPGDAQVAIFGAGRIGKIHAGNLVSQPGVRLRHVVDPDAAAAQALAARHGATVGTVDGVFADASIRAVVIASSTDTHAELIERAAAARKSCTSRRRSLRVFSCLVSCLITVLLN